MPVVFGKLREFAALASLEQKESGKGEEKVGSGGEEFAKVDSDFGSLWVCGI